MKISQLITKLQEIQEEVGDVELAHYDDMDQEYYLNVKLDLVEARPHIIKGYEDRILCPLNTKWCSRYYQTKFNKQEKSNVLVISH